MSDREALLQRIYDLGFEHERDHRGCAQCTILAIQDGLGVRNESIYKAASGLAAGAGECGDGPCGGYSGGVLMMSLFFGRTVDQAATEEGRLDKQRSARMAALLHDRFVERYGSVVCAGVQGKVFGRSFLLRDAEQKEAFHAAGAHRDPDKCCSVVGFGARWAAELILDELEAQGLTMEDVRERLGSTTPSSARLPASPSAFARSSR
jgi:hypothetical protein